ncbi:MAG: beta-lactamase family protein [Gammaproteobacteria bacterium]|nr:beta-lactamase family protein [Gammaproteobacteria bacterium]
MVAIQGELSPGFEEVGEAFQELFASFGEVGAAVAVQAHGETVVNLWAGERDRAGDQAWQADTRCNIFSASKGVVALAVLQLVDRGQLALDTAIADVWPEFGCHGKDAIRVRDVLCHRAGLNAFHPRLADDLIYDWQGIVQQVAAESPWWTPGSEQGYSPMIFGWLLGEVVCRISGASSFNDYVQANITGPVASQLVFGVDPEQHSGLAEMGPLRQPQKVVGSSLMEIMRADPRGVVNRAFANPPTLMMGTNKPAWRSAQIPAANGHASALDLAAIYGSLADLDDERLLSAAARTGCWQEQSSAMDKILHSEISFALGFMRLLPAGIRAQKYFCHPGAGGSLGYADAGEGFGFGYVSRAMGQYILLDERAEHLLSAVYRALRG